MNYKEKLVEYGLSENEAAIYLAAMELGPSPVQKIAEKAKVNRVSTYNFIKSLTLKGLMSSYEEGKKTMYVASDPDKILNFFTQQRRELDDKEKEFTQLLPQFKTILNTTNKPVVRYYEGFDGAVAMNEEMLEGADGLIENIYNRDIILKNVPERLLAELRKKRVNQNLKTISIFSNNGAPFLSDELNERHTFNDPEFPLTADITFYKDKVRFISYEKGISGIIIENKDITSTLRSLFYIALKYIKSKK